MDWQVDLGSWIYISWLMRSGGSPCFARRRGRQSRADERLGFFQDLVHVGLTAKTLGVDLIDVLGSGWPRRKPTVGRHYLQPTEWRGVAGGAGENPVDLFACLFREVDPFGLKICESGFLRGRGRWFRTI